MVLIDQALPFRGQLLDQGPFATDPSLASLFVFFSVFGSQGALTTFAFRLGASRRGVTRKEILYLNAWGLSRTFFKKFKVSCFYPSAVNALIAPQILHAILSDFELVLKVSLKTNLLKGRGNILRAPRGVCKNYFRVHKTYTTCLFYE